MTIIIQIKKMSIYDNFKSVFEQNKIFENSFISFKINLI